MKKVERRTVWIVAVAAVVLVVLMYLFVRGARLNTPVNVGGTAPNIQTQTVKGQPFMLNDLRGKPILLNFFTPWCQPCIDETPDLIAFDKKYGNDVHVVMIDRDDGPVLVQRYVSQYQLPENITVLMSENDKWSSPYGVTGQPETFFITASGKVVSHLIGPLTESQMVSYAKAAGLH